MKWAGRLLRGRTLDASLALAVALLAGRLSGLLREIELARTFGLSARADIAVLLLTLPDLLVGLLLAGGISAALVPRFRLLDEVAGAMLFRRAALFAGAGFGFAGLILAVAPGAMFAVFAPGITHLRDMLPAQASLAVALALPLTALSGVVTALLNARDRYFIAGLGTLVFNLSVIAGLLLGGPPERMLANLGLAIALGALIRLLSQIAIVPREVWRQHSLEGYSDRAVASAFVAGVGATGLALLAPILVRAAASLLGSGAVAAFNYAQKLTELPVGILITTISTVALTVFSRLVAEQNEAALRQAVGRRLRYGLLIGVTVMVFGLLFADPFVRFLLGGGGALDMTALARIAGLTGISLVGVPFVAVSSLATALLNARLQTRRVLMLTGVAIAFLPLLILPGILLDSDQALMAAVVAFQAMLALMLARAARIGLVGEDGFIDRRFISIAAAIVGLALICGGLADHVGGPDVVALAIGGMGFGMAMLMANWNRHEAAV